MPASAGGSEREVPRGAGGTSAYARTRTRPAVVRRRRVTKRVKTQSIMRGHIEGARNHVNILGRQYCEHATGGKSLCVRGCGASAVATARHLPHLAGLCDEKFRVRSHPATRSMA